MAFITEDKFEKCDEVQQFLNNRCLIKQNLLKKNTFNVQFEAENLFKLST